MPNASAPKDHKFYPGELTETQTATSAQSPFFMKGCCWNSMRLLFQGLRGLLRSGSFHNCAPKPESKAADGITMTRKWTPLQNKMPTSGTATRAYRGSPTISIPKDVAKTP